MSVNDITLFAVADNCVMGGSKCFLSIAERLLVGIFILSAVGKSGHCAN
jgi:hypothetical protein